MKVLTCITVKPHFTLEPVRSCFFMVCSFTLNDRQTTVKHPKDCVENYPSVALKKKGKRKKSPYDEGKTFNGGLKLPPAPHLFICSEKHKFIFLPLLSFE